MHRNLLDRVAEEEDHRPRSSGRPASRGVAVTGGGCGGSGGSSGGSGMVSSGREGPTLLGWGPSSGRPLEDPGLVGEEAARRAKEERIRRERDEALALENRRWDWYLCKSHGSPLPLSSFPLPTSPLSTWHVLHHISHIPYSPDNNDPAKSKRGS